jgi:hypothetical protein
MDIDKIGLVTGFIGHLQIVTTSNYSAIANSHTQQFTTERIKSSQSSMSHLSLLGDGSQQCPVFLLTFLPAGDSPTTTSLHSTTQLNWHPSWRPSHTDLLLFWLQPQDSSLMAAGPCYIISAPTAQRTSLLTALILLHACLLGPIPNSGCLFRGRCLATVYMQHYFYYSHFYLILLDSFVFRKRTDHVGFDVW